ncbi:MAG: MerR family transcriptional regulator [Paracoccaceae bacterium]
MTQTPSDTDAADTLTIRQMCDAHNVTARALRYYEAKGLLSPLRQGTRRLYTRTDRARLALILRGKRFGFSLEDIRQLLNMYDREGTNRTQLAATIAIARDRLDRMQAQRAELDLAIVDLQTQLREGERRLARPDAPSHAAE